MQKKSCRVHCEPSGRTVRCARGAVLSKVLKKAGIRIRASCGGKGQCGQCRVRLLSGEVSEPTAAERERLCGTAVAQGHRLACRTKVLGDTDVFIPEHAVLGSPFYHLACLDSQPPATLPDQTYPDSRSHLGVAVDLGTTNIAVYIFDLLSGACRGAEGAVNPQIAYGDDIMSRIAFAESNGTMELQKTVVTAINEIIARQCPEPERIVAMAVAGNTAMHHFLLALPVSQLGRAPYEPAVKDAMNVKASDIGLALHGSAVVHFLPNIGGFIGGDHAAMILATGIYKTARTMLGLDIGTNTEIVLNHKGKLYSTSCASGPAFEGGNILNGVPAVPGAVTEVSVSDHVTAYETIAHHMPAVGICGSGLFSAVAELCRLRLITPRGELQSGHGVRDTKYGRQFVIVPADRSATGDAVTLTQHDISEFQLAKAAVCAGIEALFEKAGTCWEEVAEIVITGNFGTSIDPADAVDAGLIPAGSAEKVTLVENAAADGCIRCLFSESQRSLAAHNAGRVDYLELMAWPRFHHLFARSMYFPSGKKRSGRHDG